jgi:carbon monoxide dehydrogenase subunit G
MLEKYESSQQHIRRDALTVWTALSDFDNFTPLVADRVEGWRVEGDECSFTVKGFAMGLRMTEKVPGELIRIEATDASPVGFTLWVQLKEAAPYDTRLRLVLHAEMNMMIKMMIGPKLKEGIQQLAEQIARGFNAA